MKIKPLMIITLVIFSFTNCKKDSASSLPIISAKTWIRGLNDKNLSTNPAGTITYYPVQNCEKDDTFKFGVDGNLVWNRNKEKCASSESLIETQPYTLNRTTKELTINGLKFTLAEESNNQIKYYTPVPSSTGIQYLIFLLQ